MEFIGASGRGDDESANGSRGAFVGGFGDGSCGQLVNGGTCSEERTVVGGGAVVSGFCESGGDNAEVLDQAEGEAHFDGDQEAVIQDRTESGDAGSAQSTGKVDPQTPGWTKRLRVGNQPPDRAQCPDRGGFVTRSNLSTESWNDMRAVRANPLSSKSLPCSKNKLYRTKYTQTISRKKMEQYFIVNFKSNPWSDV